MNEKLVTETLLRQFLLGKVDDEERQRIESMFVTGAFSNERVIAAEQHLIDDYLDDSLTPADKERFLAQYGDTPAAQRKLRIAKSIQDWAATSADVTPVGGVAVSRWSRLRERLRLKPVFMIPIAAVSTLAIIFAVVWLNSRWQQRNKYLAIQQEIVRLNSPSALRDLPTQTPALTLTPGAVRSAEQENELTPPAGAESVVVHLLWTQQEQYPFYEATIRSFDEQESYTIPNLQAENKVIRLRLPTRFLTRGLYLIEVTGLGANGTTSSSEEYKFVVSG
ncbi:MAG TPA: hypothetical protein VKB02_14320 [Pyrinomonadaceae bacterium]|nr:hypothetical protein [Pyrinomonadaceae bacterium]